MNWAELIRRIREAIEQAGEAVRSAGRPQPVPIPVPVNRPHRSR